MGGFMLGVVAGVSAFFWVQDVFIQNVNKGTNIYILEKAGSGQVAVFHGFLRDDEVCEKAKKALEREGGRYTCAPAESAKPIN